MAIRTLLVDDQALFRQGLRALLSLDASITIVGEAGDGVECLRHAARLEPQVVLMDLRMPRMDGVEATRQLRAFPKPPQVIALTTFDEDELVFAALQAGAIAYLLKDATSEAIVEAIRLAARGRSTLAPDVTQKVITEFVRLSKLTGARPGVDQTDLSPRERDVLRLLAQGCSNKEIATGLGIAEGTVKNHLTNVFAKLGVKDRTQAALEARALGVA